RGGSPRPPGQIGSPKAAMNSIQSPTALAAIKSAVILPALLTLSAFDLLPRGWSQTFPVTYPTIGRIIKEDPRLERLIPSNAKIEVLASGMKFAEGPVWVKDGGYLLFSDVPNNSVMKWKQGEGLTVFMKPSGYTGVVNYGAEPGS